MAGRPKKRRTLEDVCSLLDGDEQYIFYLTPDEAYIEEVENKKSMAIVSYYYEKAVSNIRQMQQQAQQEIETNLMAWHLKAALGIENTEPVPDPAELYQKTFTIKDVQKECHKIKAEEPNPDVEADLQAKLAEIENSFDSSKLYPRPWVKGITGEDFSAIYKNIKLLKFYHKWACKPPVNGRANYYTVICELFEGQPPIKRDRALYRSGMYIVAAAIDYEGSTKQEALYNEIRQAFTQKSDEEKSALSDIITLSVLGEGNPSNREGLFRQRFNATRQRMESINFSDLTARADRAPKEKITATYTSGPIVFEKGGYFKFVQEIDKQNEKDTEVNPFNGYKTYKNQYSALTLTLQTASGSFLKSPATSKILNVVMQLAKQDENEVKKTARLEIGKDDYMRLLCMTQEEINDKATRQNFFAAQLKQFAFLRSLTWTIERGEGEGSVGGIFNNVEVTRNTVVFYFDNLFLARAFLGIAEIPYTLEGGKIPNRNALEYYLFEKLQNLYTNKKRKQHGKQEYTQISSVISHLEERRLLDTKTKKYKEKICDRFIEALNDLQERELIEYYITPAEDGQPIQPVELAKYKNRSVFPNLFIWFNILSLEQFQTDQ